MTLEERISWIFILLRVTFSVQVQALRSPFSVLDMLSLPKICVFLTRVY